MRHIAIIVAVQAGIGVAMDYADDFERGARDWIENEVRAAAEQHNRLVEEDTRRKMEILEQAQAERNASRVPTEFGMTYMRWNEVLVPRVREAGAVRFQAPQPRQMNPRPPIRSWAAGIEADDDPPPEPLSELSMASLPFVGFFLAWVALLVSVLGERKHTHGRPQTLFYEEGRDGVLLW